MRLSHEGLSLWYGTPDAPAPIDEMVARDGVSIVAGVHPANPTNVVSVRFRVDGGIVQTAAGRQLRTDYDRQAQYFAVRFPSFATGEVVEYAPMLSCAGRQVPPAHLADRFPSKFHLAPKAPPHERANATAPAASGLRFAAELEYLAGLTALGDVQYVGKTPEGAHVDYFVREGRLVGPAFAAKVYPGSSDHMIVRPDGIGVVRVRAELIADDGARFELEALGSADFGEGGYEAAVAGKLPSRATVVLCPRIVTGHPKYLWLNRVQCIGVGGTHLDEGRVEYDVFAVASRARPAR